LVRATNGEVETAILDYVGILGFARAAYMPVKEKGIRDKGKGVMIGSCLVGSLDEVRAGLALVGICVEKVSGTLKGLGKGLKV